MGDEAFMEVKQEVVDGYIYESGNGQLVVDTHPTDEAHLLAPATRTSQPLYDCRRYLKDLVPKEWLGQHGKILINKTVAKDGTVLSVSLTFIPKVKI